MAAKAKKAKSASAVEQGAPRNLALRVREESWPIRNLRGYELNAKEHPQEQIDLIRASYREFGEVDRVVVDEGGEIIAGHGRHQALLQENVADVRVMVAIDWSDEQKRRYRLLHNQLTQATGYDKKKLKEEIQALHAIGVAVDDLGFAPAEIARLLHVVPTGLQDGDEVPEPEARPISARGDVWLLGSHRIVCGDCTNPGDVEKVLCGQKPALMVTDQPYGVEYDADWRNDMGLGAMATGVVSNDDVADWREAWRLFSGDVAYVYCASLRSDEAIAGLEAVDLERRSLIIWNKMQHAISRGHYHWQHEVCWYVVRKGKTAHWAGDRKQTTVWDIEKPRKSETGHSTQKPVECMQRPIENNSQPGDAVYEPFSGSGTTIIAAEISGRKCYAIELNPLYVDVAVKRWQNFTGLVATLEGDGRSFDLIAVERAAVQTEAAA